MDASSWVDLGELLVKVLAVIGALVWGGKFLHQRDLAQVQLSNLQIDLDAKFLDLQAKLIEQQTAIRIEIQATLERNPDGSGYVILSTVEIINDGGTNTRFNWGSDPSFYLRAVSFADGKPVYEQEIGYRVPLTINPSATAVSHIVRAGRRESIHFAIPVSSPGLYLLSFRGALDDQDRSVSQELGANQSVAWTANRYIFVDDTRLPSVSGSPVR